MSSYDVCFFVIFSSRMYFEFFFIKNQQMNQKCNYDDLCDFSDLNTVGATSQLFDRIPRLASALPRHSSVA